MEDLVVLDVDVPGGTDPVAPGRVRGGELKEMLDYNGHLENDPMLRIVLFTAPRTVESRGNIVPVRMKPALVDAQMEEWN